MEAGFAIASLAQQQPKHARTHITHTHGNPRIRTHIRTQQYCGDWYKNSKDRRPLSCNGDDIWPATFPNGVRIVDLWTGKEVASFKEGVYTANVASHDTAFVRVYPL